MDPPPIHEPSLARPRAADVLYASAAPPDFRYPLAPIDGAAAAADILIAALVMGAFSIITIVSNLTEAMQRMLPRGGHFLWVLANGLLALGTVALLLRHRGFRPGQIGLGAAAPLKVLLATIAAVPACYFAGAVSNMIVTLLSGGDFVTFARERTDFFAELSDIPLCWIFPLSLFVGVYEEILFRGFLLSRLRALASSNVVPILLSSLIFGGLHYTQGLVGMCQTTVVGLVLAIVAVRARTLWPAILAHAAIDTISLVITALFTDEMREMLRTIASQPAS